MSTDDATRSRLARASALAGLLACGALIAGVSTRGDATRARDYAALGASVMLDGDGPGARDVARSRRGTDARARMRAVRRSAAREARREARAYAVDEATVANAARELHRRESYAFVDGELVGDVDRRAWARAHELVSPWGAPRLAVLGSKSRAREEEGGGEDERGSRASKKSSGKDVEEKSSKHHSGEKESSKHHSEEKESSKHHSEEKESSKHHSEEKESSKHHSEEKESSKHSKKSKMDDETADLGHHDEKLSTPVYIMSLGDKPLPHPDPTLGSTDTELVKQLVKILVREFGTAAVKKFVRLTPGVDVSDWPREEDTMHYALKTIMANKPKGTQLTSLPWISFYTSRDQKGHFADKFAQERNLQTHIGCLFGHMFQWQLAADAGDDNAFMFEADAFNKFSVGLPFKDMQVLADNAPKGYDVIFFDMPRDMEFDAPVKTIENADGEEIYIFAFNKKSAQSGLSATLVSKRFYPKIFKHMSHFGADVVDAMLKVQLCTDSMVDSSGKFKGFGAGNKPWLQCYWALPAKEAKKHGSKYVYGKMNSS